MNFPQIYSSEFFCWAPGVTTHDEWIEWKNGTRSIKCEKSSPKLEFADPLFKRRLSQITRMTIQVIHDLLEKIPEASECKQVFVSFRGEIEREFSINENLIKDSEIMPAGFSLSVFNTPIAAATICLKLKAGYSVIYPSCSNNNQANAFAHAMKGVASPLLCGDEESVIFVYADEFVPEVYGELRSENSEPMAFACLLSREKSVHCAKSIDIDKIEDVKKFIRESI